MKILSKIKTLWWFAVRPALWPQLAQLAKRRLNSEMENSRSESTAWCAERVVNKETALKVFSINTEFKTLNEIFPDVISSAKKKEQSAPVQMGGEGAISFLYHLVRANKLKILVESGVAYGWSSLAMLLAIKDVEGARLISNDMPYVQMNNEDFVGCIIPEELNPKWELQRLADVTGIPKAFGKIKGPIDLFHYDSDKSYTGRMWASDLIWDKLREGGFFVSDDINDNLAFKHFADKISRKPVIIEHLGKYVGIIRK